jgi:hypothetical protein
MGARSVAAAFILLLSLAMIIFVFFGSQMMEAGIWLVVVFVVILLFGSMSGAVWLVSRSGERGSGEGVPRGVIKLLAVGLAIVGMGFMIFFGAIAILPLEARSAELFFLFLGLVIVGMGIAFAGRISAEVTYAARQFQVPESLLDSLRQIGPDKSFETKKFHIFRKSGIYILLQRRLRGVHFIRLFKQTPVAAKKVKVSYWGPWRTSVRSFKDEINGLRLAKVRREFTVPVDIVRLGDRTEAKYVRGPGILYYVSVYPMGRFSVNYNEENLCGRLDPPTIIKVLNDLSEEKAADAST